MKLEILMLTPIIGSLLVLMSREINSIRVIGLWISGITFLESIILWLQLRESTERFQYVSTYDWIGNIHWTLGVDGLSVLFIVLTTFLIPICLLVGWKAENQKAYVLTFLIMEALMIGVFCQLDLIFFYVFFESVLIPMFLIIGIWGSRERKIRAAYQFFLYTLVGSLLMLLGILLIYFEIGSSDYEILYYHVNSLSEKRQILLWLLFFASFSVKLPMVPVHLWLPEAHVEAPTAGSVILAGILLKLGGYGLIRFSLGLFPLASAYFTPLVYTLSIIAIIYTSLTTLRQIDLKKIIAYSSVAHMNLVTLGLFSGTIEGIEGSILLMLSHGLVSSGLFLCVGSLYERHKTRLLDYYGGCVQVMPLYSTFLVFFTLGNISLPGTSSFIGEFLVLIGTYESNKFITIIASLSMVLGAGYSLWLCNRICFGPIKNSIITYADINRREFNILIPFVIGILWMGIYPYIFIESIHATVSSLIII